MHNTGGFSYEILTVILFGKYIWLVYKCNKVVYYSDMSFVEWTLDEWPSGNDLLPSHDRLSEKKKRLNDAWTFDVSYNCYMDQMQNWLNDKGYM